MDEQTKLARNEAAFRRWQSRLTRAANMVRKLDQEHRRILRRMAKLPKIGGTQNPEINPARLGSPGRSEPEKITAALVEQAPPPPCTEVIQPAMQTGLPSPDDLSIPAQFLRGKQADDKARAEITAQIEARKAIKAKASKARSVAKAKGELRKMPLSGKAALAFIAQK